MHEDYIVKISNLSVEFGGGMKKFGKSPVKAIKDVSFSLETGKNFGLLGESGAGKTTIAKIIGGIIRPSSGTIFYHGINHLQIKRKDLAKIVQVVFQDASSSLNPSMKVGKILSEAFNICGKVKKKDREREILKNINSVGLFVDILNRYPFELSGGQRQRVCIARAMISSPDLIVFDEVFSASDHRNNNLVIKILRDIQKKTAISYLFIDHDPLRLKKICDVIGIMRDGELLEYGNTEELFLSQKNKYSKKLFSSIIFD